jgi:hypothetical protein
MRIQHRDADGEDDLAFVVSTWSRAFKASPTAGMIADEDWAGVMHGQIRKLIARPGVRTVVACDPAEPRFLYGFIAGDPELRVVHFCYVKQPFRRAGCARGLFNALGIDPLLPFRFTCWTYAVPELGAKTPRATYDANLARYAD